MLAAMQQEFTELNWAEVTGKMASSPVVLDLKNRIPRTLDEQVKVKRI
ncbi:hypothetical protein ACLMAB_16340 [Brevibacillus laterosporus]